MHGDEFAVAQFVDQAVDRLRPTGHFLGDNGYLPAGPRLGSGQFEHHPARAATGRIKHWQSRAGSS
jgi:hypothetical protein